MTMSPISNLANMEYALYGGRNLAMNSATPNYLNGYQGNPYASNSLGYGSYGYGYNQYPNYNQSYANYGSANPYMNNNYQNYYAQNGYSNPQTYAQYQAQPSNTAFQATNANGYGRSLASSLQGSVERSGSGIAKRDLDILMDNYARGMKEEEGGESVVSAATTGVIPLIFFEQAQNFKHWKNAGVAASKANAFLKDINGINALRESNPQLMHEAYSQLHASFRNAESKWKWLGQGAFQKTLSNEVKAGEELTTLAKGLSPKAQIEALQNELKTAIEAAAADPSKLKDVAEATAKLKKARGMDGWLVGGSWLGKTPYERLEKAMNAGEKGAPSALEREAAELLEKNKVTNEVFANIGTKAGLQAAGKSIWSAIKKDAPMWIAMDFLMDLFLTKNIQTAFEKDTTSGMIQLGQTTVKAAGSAAGWGAGRAVGTWAGMKIGAKIGSRFSPGWGTAIGAIIGMIGGSVGMCLANKVTEKVIGENIGEKIKRENMTKTQEGQLELVQYAIQQAESGKQLDPQTMQALNNVATQFSATA